VKTRLLALLSPLSLQHPTFHLFLPELGALDFGCWWVVLLLTADCSLPVTLTVICTKSATAARGASHVNVRVTGTGIGIGRQTGTGR